MFTSPAQPTDPPSTCDHLGLPRALPHPAQVIYPEGGYYKKHLDASEGVDPHGTCPSQAAWRMARRWMVWAYYPPDRDDAAHARHVCPTIATSPHDPWRDP